MTNSICTPVLLKAIALTCGVTVTMPLWRPGLTIQDPSDKVLRVERLETKELVVTDATGKRRATLGASSGGFFLEFRDADNVSRLKLGINSEGNAGLELCDHDRTTSSLIQTSNGQSVLMLGKRDKGTPSVIMSAKTGECLLSFYNEHGKGRAAVGLRSDDESGLWMSADGKMQASMMVSPEKGVAMIAYDEAGQLRLMTGVGMDSSAGLRVWDSDGHPRIALRIAADGNPSMAILDKNGKEAWAARETPEPAAKDVPSSSRDK